MKFCLFSALTVVLTGSLSFAQVSIQATPKIAGSPGAAARAGVSGTAEGCLAYLLYPPKSKKLPFSLFSAAAVNEEPGVENIQECVQTLKSELERFAINREAVRSSQLTAAAAHAAFFGSDLTKPNSVVVEPRELNFADANSVSLYLMKAHSIYKNLKRWRSHVKSPSGQAIASHGSQLREVDRSLDRLGDLVHDLMSAEGLREVFSTVLDTGITWADAGNANVPSARDSGEIQARGIVGWESKHFGDDDAPAHFSIGGSLGFVSVLSLARTSETGESTVSEPQTIFQQAFAWDFVPKVSFPMGTGELGLFGRVGQSRLTSDTESFTRGEDTIVAVRINNNTGRNEYFWESGVEFKLYNRPLDVVHHEKNFLLPAFSLAVGYRKDNRFRNGGDGFGDLTIRPDRMFYRLTVSLNRILNLTNKEIVNKDTLSIRFSVDHDRPLRGSQVPPSTKLVFGGDVDLLRALKGQ
jgi:hypothetical protein